jgi:hypothetical protein
MKHTKDKHSQLNLINGKIVRKNGGLAFSSNIVEFFLPASLGKAVWAGKIQNIGSVVLGISPDDIKLGANGETDIIELRGEIITIKPLESSTLILTRVGDEKIYLNTSTKPKLFCGQAISLAFNLGSVFLIHGISGEIITRL